MDCRNRASFPDTPWAPASGTTRIATNATVRSPKSLVDGRLGATLILSMTVVARGIHIPSGCHHLVSAFRLCRAQGDRPGIDERLRHRDPVALVDRAAAD